MRLAGSAAPAPGAGAAGGSLTLTTLCASSKITTVPFRSTPCARRLWEGKGRRAAWRRRGSAGSGAPRPGRGGGMGPHAGSGRLRGAQPSPVESTRQGTQGEAPHTPAGRGLGGAPGTAHCRRAARQGPAGQQAARGRRRVTPGTPRRRRTEQDRAALEAGSEPELEGSPGGGVWLPLKGTSASPKTKCPRHGCRCLCRHAGAAGLPRELTPEPTRVAACSLAAPDCSSLFWTRELRLDSTVPRWGARASWNPLCESGTHSFSRRPQGSPALARSNDAAWRAAASQAPVC